MNSNGDTVSFGAHRRNDEGVASPPLSSQHTGLVAVASAVVADNLLHRDHVPILADVPQVEHPLQVAEALGMDIVAPVVEQTPSMVPNAAA